MEEKFRNHGRVDLHLDSFWLSLPTGLCKSGNMETWKWWPACLKSWV